jgi:hypothetical protein
MRRTIRRLAFSAVLLVLAGPAAWADGDPDCWAGKLRTDLRTGEVRFECMEEPESWRRFTRLRQLAELGTAARKDAPYVIERLQDENWDVRAEAARTLGRIGATEAIPQLLAAVTPNDWRLTFEAMSSLVELKAPQADAVLATIASSYWLPSIAEAARNLGKGEPPPRSAATTSFRLTLDVCNAKADRTSIPRCSSPSDEADGRRYAEENNAYWRLFRRKFRNQPDLSGASRALPTLDVPDGRLIGTDHGEFGGALGFLNTRTHAIQETIIDENVLGLVQRRDRVVVVTGLDHGGLNRGYIWQVRRAGDGRWAAQRLWRLPGTPYEILAAPNGTIGLFGRFGSVLYRTDDTLQWLACGPFESCRR